MMPKIGDVSNDWMLISRRPGKSYKYTWECQACGDTIEKYNGAPPLHPCHRRFSPQTNEEKQLVNCWYHLGPDEKGFDLNETAIKAGLDYKTTRERLLACEVAPWPRVSPDVHHAEDDYIEVGDDG